jgi:hypothetical protein
MFGPFYTGRMPERKVNARFIEPMLLVRHRAGEIELPPVRFIARNPLVDRARPMPVLMDATPVVVSVQELKPVEVQQVRRTGDEPLFNSLIEQHHYLGYQQPVGEHLKYLVWAQGRPIACLAWSSAPRHLGSRDRYLGWSQEARKPNIRFIALNFGDFVGAIAFQPAISPIVDAVTQGDGRTQTESGWRDRPPSRQEMGVADGSPVHNQCGR